MLDLGLWTTLFRHLPHSTISSMIIFGELTPKDLQQPLEKALLCAYF